MNGRHTILLAISVLIGLILPIQASPFTVNSTGDESDPNPGDGICGIQQINHGGPSSGPCTLRAAIETANAHAGDDTIQINIPLSDPNCPGGVCTIKLTQVLPDLSTNMSISGPGASQLVVQRDAGGSYRVFHVTTAGFATFDGMTISNGLGAIINDNPATLTVTNCILTGNSTSIGLGGGIYNNSTGPVN